MQTNNAPATTSSDDLVAQAFNVAEQLFSTSWYPRSGTKMMERLAEIAGFLEDKKLSDHTIALAFLFKAVQMNVATEHELLVKWKLPKDLVEDICDAVRRVGETDETYYKRINSYGWNSAITCVICCDLLFQAQSARTPAEFTEITNNLKSLF